MDTAKAMARLCGCFLPLPGWKYEYSGRKWDEQTRLRVWGAVPRQKQRHGRLLQACAELLTGRPDWTFCGLSCLISHSLITHLIIQKRTHLIHFRITYHITFFIIYNFYFLKQKKRLIPKPQIRHTINNLHLKPVQKDAGNRTFCSLMSNSESRSPH